MADARTWEDHWTEPEKVRQWRFDEARRDGLDVIDAQRFADGDGNLELFRNAAADGCPLDLLAAIFI